MTLLDGFVSYLGNVITAGAPVAVWQVGYHRIKAYHLQNHPVLSSPHTDSQIHSAKSVAVTANCLRRDMDPVPEGRFTAHAAAVIAELRGEVKKMPEVQEPLVEVGEEDGVFDVGLREDIAHEHSRKVDRMVKKLATQPGVDSVFREDREMLLVTAPDWNAERLERWILGWLSARLPASR